MRDIEFPIWTRQFPSGLRVIAERDTRTPNVALVLVVGTGSSDDPAGKEGLAHYVEHLAFRSRPNGTSTFWSLLEHTGASQWNAVTNLDETVYMELGPKQSLGSLLKLEGQRMVKAVQQVSPDAFGVQLDIVRNELRQRNETGFIGEVLGVMQGALFPAGHRYARSVGGTHASLSTLTADDVATFLKKHYRADNMTLELIGNFELEGIDKLVLQSLPKELLEQHVPTATPHAAFAPKAPPSPTSPRFVKTEAAVATPELWMGWTLPPAFASNRAYVLFAQNVIDGALQGVNAIDSDIVSVSTTLINGKEASVLLCRVRLTNGSHPEISAEHVLRKISAIGAPPGIPAYEYMRELEFTQQKHSAAVEMVLDAENLVSRGVQRALITRVTDDASEYSRGLTDVALLERTSLVEFVTTYIHRDRARMVLFQPRVQSGELPPAIGFGADVVDDEDNQPIHADATQLTRIAPSLGAHAYASITLDNGLEVIFAKRPGLPVVTMTVRFSTGLADAQDLAAAHAAHLAIPMHSGFYGVPAEFGGQFGRNYGRTSINYTMTGASGNADIMLAIMAESVNRQSIAPAEWEAFRRDRIPFFEILERQPEAVGERAFFKTLFRGSKYGREFKTSLWADTTPNSIQQWLTETHVPNNAVLVIAGEFDRETVETIVREHFGEWVRMPKITSPTPAVTSSSKPVAEPQLVVTHRPGATQALIVFGCVLPPAYKASTDVQHDLGAGFLDQRLHEILREKGGVTYGFHANAWLYQGGTSYLEVAGAVEQSKLVYSLTVLKRALEDFAQKPVDARDLARMKLRLARRHAARFMSNSSIATSVSSYKAHGFPITTLDDFGRLLGNVTEQDIQGDFKACFAGNPTVAIVGDAAAAQAAFKDVWQTPTVPSQ